MHTEVGTDPSFYYLYGNKSGLDGQADAPSPTRIIDPGQLRTRGVEPWHQKHWDWKAAGNFICGGAGSGLFACAAIASLLYDSQWLLGGTALALIALGLFLVLLKIGRPLRAIYVLRQPQRSWMAREAWIALALFPIATLAGWYATPWLVILAAFLGLSFLFCQAMILKEAKGIPAWRISAVVPLILLTGLAEGCGLFLAGVSLMPALNGIAELTAVIVICLSALRSWTWRSYFTALQTMGAPKRALVVLEAFRPWLFVFGLVVPFILIVLGMMATALAFLLLPLAGISVLAAGVALKFILVTRAGYNQGFALPHTPARGSSLPGPAVRPGWSH
jgi:phenylacetyl-CoA:acceptor oxidoreductase subunit 2